MHKHADLMLEYAQDAAKTDKPWELWEARSVSVPERTTMRDNPIWYVNVEYRRKPRQVTLSVPKGETKEPEYGTIYFYPNIESMEVTTMTWTNHRIDKKLSTTAPLPQRSRRTASRKRTQNLV